ncbi:MAG: UDP-2,3-diacylglucosamine diphosphatase [Gammaproteobacteria bacterium]
MTQTLFISDLHLDKERPQIVELFADFLQRDARNADALYILGDLFEYWIGDDDPAPGLQGAVEGIAALAAAGVPVHFIHGNRDFLVGPRFAQQAGCRLLPETEVIDLYGERTLIMHGDTLCTDDVAYQQFRAMVRNPQWQTGFLAKTLVEREAMARGMRERSKKETSGKAEDIMDVNQRVVENVMREHRVHRLIHGHTHRPATHEFALDGRDATRTVLGDWYQQGSVLRCTPQGYESLNLKT